MSGAPFTQSSPPALLQVREVVRRFGGLLAVSDVSFEARAHEVTGLIGPNGAGKTTMFNLITGVLPLTSGRIAFGGHPIHNEPAHLRAPLGISRTFQIVRLFPALTVLENVMLGFHPKLPDGLLRSLLKAGTLARQELGLRAAAQEHLGFVGLEDHGHREVGHLSLGQQRLVDVARALAAGPRLLLLDEPAAGLNEAETDSLAAMLAKLKADGMSILIVEHDIGFIRSVCDRIVVMNRGAKIADADPDAVMRDDAVIAAYLGRRTTDAAH